MVTEKSCNLAEKWVHLPEEKGNGTNWACCKEDLLK